MSEFNEPYQDQIDSSNVICPYCKSEYQPECEDFDERPRDQECSDCGKTYRLYQSFSVDHHTEPDCELNQEQHDYKMHQLGNGKKHRFCEKCGKCEPYKKDKS